MSDNRVYFTEPTTVFTDAVWVGANNIRNGDDKSSIWRRYIEYLEV